MTEGDYDPALFNLIVSCKVGAIHDAERERMRQRDEPPPYVVGGSQYDSMVQEIKRIAVEYDAVEESDAANVLQRCMSVDADAKCVGHQIYNLGGEQLMHLTLQLYVPRMKGLHRCFDLAFNGIGEWLA